MDLATLLSRILHRPAANAGNRTARSGWVSIAIGAIGLLLGLFMWVLAAFIRVPGELNRFFVVGYLVIFLGAIFVVFGVARLRRVSPGPEFLGLGLLWLLSAASWSVVVVPELWQPVFDWRAALPIPLARVADLILGGLVIVGTLIGMVAGLVISFVYVPVLLFLHFRHPIAS